MYDRIGSRVRASYNGQWIHIGIESIRPLGRNLDIQEYLSDYSFIKHRVNRVSIVDNHYTINYIYDWAYELETNEHLDIIAELINSDGNIEYYIVETIDNEIKCIASNKITFKIDLKLDTDGK